MLISTTERWVAPWVLHFYSGRSLWRAAVAVWLLALIMLGGRWALSRLDIKSVESVPASVDEVASVRRPAVGTWPERKVIDEVLLDMNRARERAGLQWGAGGLVVRPLDGEATGVLGRADIAMNISGTYAQLRRMVTALLNAYPTLALVSIEVRREDASRARLEAQLRWVFVHDAGQGAATYSLPMPMRAPVTEAWIDPFAAPSIVATPPKVRAPPPPVAVPVVVPAPSAPPLPFKFLGRVSGQARSSESPAVFLALGKQVLRVQVGDTLAGQYRVDAIEEGVVRLTYLPLNERQSLLLR